MSLTTTNLAIVDEMLHHPALVDDEEALSYGAAGSFDAGMKQLMVSIGDHKSRKVTVRGQDDRVNFLVGEVH